MPGITLVTKNFNGLPKLTLPNSKSIFKGNREISLFHNEVPAETFTSVTVNRAVHSRTPCRLPRACL